jgi:crossover junction endodeoxyribonuclease RuvC
MNMLILGIDPGTATTGWGIIKIRNPKSKVQSPKFYPERSRRAKIQNPVLVAFGCIKTSAKKSLAERLKIIYNELNRIIKKYKPRLVAVEEIFFAKNTKTAIKVGHARGVCLLAAANNKIPVCELTPLQVKQGLTGYGRADKQQIQKMIKILLNLKEIPKPDDAADALAVAITAAHGWKMKERTEK